MTEAATVFHEDVAERSNVKKSAQCRKNGSNTMKLGNRRMSYKEIMERHGDVKLYNLDAFLSYPAFRELPNDLKIEYVNKLCDKYDVGIKHISRFLFHQDDTALQRYLSINGILKFCNPDKKRGKIGLDQFRNDILATSRNQIVEEEKEVKMAENQQTGMQFITNEIFKKLSNEEKIEYVNGLMKEYKVGLGAISKDLFGKSESNLDIYFRSKNLRDRVIKAPDFVLKADMQKNRNAFRKAISEWKNAEETVKEVKETVTEETNAVGEVKMPEIEGTLSSAVEAPLLTKIDPNPKMEVNSGEIMDYRDSSYTSSYIRSGLDEDELDGLKALFHNKRVKVDIRIIAI